MTTSRRLDEVCDIVMGQAPSGDAYNTDGVGWPLIAGAGDFGDAYPVVKKYTTEASRLSQSGDIVLGIRASIGDKVLSDGVYCLGRGVASLRPRKELDSRNLWHWLTFSRRVLASKAKGATFKQVNRDDISGMTITILPLSEQRQIADLLDQADAMRTERRATLAQLDSLTQAVLVDMFGSLSANPKGYPVATMIELVDSKRPITYGILKPGRDVIDGVPYVRVVDMTDRSIHRAGLRRTTEAISSQYKRSLLREGDLLPVHSWTRGSARVGRR